MRIRIAALITGLLAVTGMVLGIGLAGPASAQSDPYNICTPPNTTPSQCWNNTAGEVVSGNKLQFWQNNAEGAENNAWYLEVVGTVKDGEGGVLWPFTDGSQLNTRYNGANVYQFFLYKNSDYCASGSAFNTLELEGPVDLESCGSSNKFQYFVLSDEGYLVNVGASNALYTSYDIPDQPVWVSAPAGTGDGEPLIMNTTAQLVWSINSVPAP